MIPALPLRGRRVVVTRAAAQAQGLRDRLEAAGAVVETLPLLGIMPPPSFAPLDTAIAELPRFSGFIFTSANGVKGFFDRVLALGQAPPARPPGSWVCAVGPATAEGLPPEWRADHLPPVYRAEALIDFLPPALAPAGLAGQRILWPRSARARDSVAAQLQSQGAAVTTAEAYDTAPPAAARQRAQAIFAVPPDAVLFTSASAARNLAGLLGETCASQLRGVRLASIGPVTTAALRQLGLRADIQAAAATAGSLADAVMESFSHA